MRNTETSNSFKVGLNWKGIFEVITYIIGIIMALFLFIYIIAYAIGNEPDVAMAEKVIVLLIPIGLFILCEWRLIHLIFDRVIVRGNEVVITRAFRKKQIINVDEIVSYSNTENNEKGHRFYEISVVFGEKESIEIRNDIYKNYDFLLRYLAKN